MANLAVRCAATSELSELKLAPVALLTQTGSDESIQASTPSNCECKSRTLHPEKEIVSVKSTKVKKISILKTMFVVLAVKCALETIDQHLYPSSSPDYLSAVDLVALDNDRELKSLRNSNFRENSELDLTVSIPAPWQSDSALLSTREEIFDGKYSELHWDRRIRKKYTRPVPVRAPENSVWCLFSGFLKYLSFEFVKPVRAIINVVRIDAPKSIVVGQPIMLKCFIEIRNDKLVSLSWLKDNNEFYRYQPGEKRRELYFKVKGVNVENNKSRAPSKENIIHLVNTTLDSSGTYSCDALSSRSYTVSRINTVVSVKNGCSSTNLHATKDMIFILAAVLVLNYIVSRM